MDKDLPLQKPFLGSWDWETHIRTPDEAKSQLRALSIYLNEAGFDLKKSTKILEIGSGEGLFTRYLIDLGYDIVAIEARPRGDNSIPVAKLSFEQTPFDDEDSNQRFDLIVGLSAIDPEAYPQNLTKIFTEMARILEPGGYMFLSPNYITETELRENLPATLEIVCREAFHTILRKQI